MPDSSNPLIGSKSRRPAPTEKTQASDDAVLRAATTFEERVQTGDALLLSPEESDRRLTAIRQDQIAMRRNIEVNRKK